MYNYNFNDDIVLYEKNDCLINYNNRELFVNILITKKYLLVFVNIADDFFKMKTCGLLVSPSYELLKKYEFGKFKYEINDNNTYLDDMIIYNFDLNELNKEVYEKNID